MCRVRVLDGCSSAANEFAAGALAESLMEALRQTDALPPKGKGAQSLAGGTAGAVKHLGARQSAERVVLEQEL